MLAHNVFFSLHDKSPEAKAKLINSAKMHLTGHAGVLFFAVGELASELNRPVNDRDFDVALHIVFANNDDHDLYQNAPRHHKFVEESKDGWAKVRVFDSIVDRT
jgi:Stress responsive A/B Barrel Domain